MITITGSLSSLLHEYLESGNSSHLVVGSEMAKMESGSGSDTGLIALLMQISKALHRRTPDELLGMRLKLFLLLGYVRDRGAAPQRGRDGRVLNPEAGRG